MLFVYDDYDVYTWCKHLFAIIFNLLWWVTHRKSTQISHLCWLSRRCNACSGYALSWGNDLSDLLGCYFNAAGRDKIRRNNNPCWLWDKTQVDRGKPGCCKSLETHANSSCKFRFHDALCTGKLCGPMCFDWEVLCTSRTCSSLVAKTRCEFLFTSLSWFDFFCFIAWTCLLAHWATHLTWYLMPAAPLMKFSHFDQFEPQLRLAIDFLSVEKICFQRFSMTDRIEADMASGGLGSGIVQLCAVGGCWLHCTVCFGDKTYTKGTGKVLWCAGSKSYVLFLRFMKFHFLNQFSREFQSDHTCRWQRVEYCEAALGQHCFRINFVGLSSSHLCWYMAGSRHPSKASDGRCWFRRWDSSPLDCSIRTSFLCAVCPCKASSAAPANCC